jgi:exodeoxyribonuclease VII large subunit
MLLKVRGVPRLHERYGFNVVFNSISPTGSGSIKRANELLVAKLESEGLFAPERKRSLPYPPNKVGLITSYKSAAFTDFKRILNNRWSGVEVDCYDVNVQGDQAPGEIIQAIDFFSSLSIPPEALVVIRGGGSPEDLATFNNEQVVRAVAGSRVPTLVAIGHESDVSLAELAADARASTPSNAAEIIVPDKKVIIHQLQKLPEQLSDYVEGKVRRSSGILGDVKNQMAELAKARINRELTSLERRLGLIKALSPKDILKRGFAIVRRGHTVSDGHGLKPGSIVTIELYLTKLEASITRELKGN